MSNNTIIGLRWVLGLVILLESAHFAISPGAARQLAAIGLARWTAPALGGSEVVAALLFLVPAASMVGGYALLFIFLLAAGVHVLHGQFDVGYLAIFGMAVIVCMADRKKQTSGVTRDR
jgi:hypothetical protein